MLDVDRRLTDDAARAAATRLAFACFSPEIMTELAAILTGYRDAIRAPLLEALEALEAELAALERELNAARRGARGAAPAAPRDRRDRPRRELEQ